MSVHAREPPTRTQLWAGRAAASSLAEGSARAHKRLSLAFLEGELGERGATGDTRSGGGGAGVDGAGVEQSRRKEADATGLGQRTSSTRFVSRTSVLPTASASQVGRSPSGSSSTSNLPRRNPKSHPLPAFPPNSPEALVYGSSDSSSADSSSADSASDRRRSTDRRLPPADDPLPNYDDDPVAPPRHSRRTDSAMPDVTPGRESGVLAIDEALKASVVKTTAARPSFGARSSRANPAVPGNPPISSAGPAPAADPTPSYPSPKMEPSQPPRPPSASGSRGTSKKSHRTSKVFVDTTDDLPNTVATPESTGGSSSPDRSKSSSRSSRRPVPIGDAENWSGSEHTSDPDMPPPTKRSSGSAPGYVGSQVPVTTTPSRKAASLPRLADIKSSSPVLSPTLRSSPLAFDDSTSASAGVPLRTYSSPTEGSFSPPFPGKSGKSSRRSSKPDDKDTFVSYNASSASMVISSSSPTSSPTTATAPPRKRSSGSVTADTRERQARGTPSIIPVGRSFSDPSVSPVDPSPTPPERDRDRDRERTTSSRRSKAQSVPPNSRPTSIARDSKDPPMSPYLVAATAPTSSRRKRGEEGDKPLPDVPLGRDRNERNERGERDRDRERDGPPARPPSRGGGERTKSSRHSPTSPDPEIPDRPPTSSPEGDPWAGQTPEVVIEGVSDGEEEPPPQFMTSRVLGAPGAAPRGVSVVPPMRGQQSSVLSSARQVPPRSYSKAAPMVLPGERERERDREREKGEKLEKADRGDRGDRGDRDRDTQDRDRDRDRERRARNGSGYDSFSQPQPPPSPMPTPSPVPYDGGGSQEIHMLMQGVRPAVGGWDEGDVKGPDGRTLRDARDGRDGRDMREGRSSRDMRDGRDRERRNGRQDGTGSGGVPNTASGGAAIPPRWASNNNPMAATRSGSQSFPPPSKAASQTSSSQSQRTTRSREGPPGSSPLPGPFGGLAAPAAGSRSRTEMDLDLRFNPDVVPEVITIKKEPVNDYWDPVWVDRLTKYREEVKMSDDVDDKFAFGRWVIEMGLNAKWSDPEPAYAERNKDGLLKEGSRVIKKLARGTLGKQGHPPAQFLLADYHSSGQAEPHIEKSHAKAFALYVAISKAYRAPNSITGTGSGKKDAEMAVVAAQATFRAGTCCEDGLGVKKDPLRAVQFYRKAASFSDTHAMHKMGHLYLTGSLGVAKSPREGVSWLKRAAAQADEGFPAPLHDLAQIYEGVVDTGGAAMKDVAYAYTLYLRAAQIGYTKSQYQLGLAHEIGLLGLPTDARRSIAWYNLGAQAGDPDCELGLSGWYVTGCEGVLIPNDDLAYKWARSAAEKGLARAEAALGFFIESGVGSPGDLNEAKYWYNRAAEHGDRRARARLEDIANGRMTIGHSTSSLNRRKSVRDETERRRELGRQGRLAEVDEGKGCSLQ
ncbi:hypothetical protein HDU93_007964 [Gonapodya sp. JEL0774]|nr:hypothetical protein HDU93_007964 [Gonapodya sp. JEL0774]